MKVLLVDDELGYRAYLAEALTTQGHEVTTAATGREAIATGLWFRPELLVADWLLTDRYHGLRVSRVLRALEPTLQTILITGFPSADLAWEAEQATVLRTLTKPFREDTFQAALDEAEVAGQPESSPSPVAVVVTDGTGAVHQANPAARDVCRTSVVHGIAQHLAEVLGAAWAERVAAARERWVEVRDVSGRWWMRARRWSPREVEALPWAR